MVAGELEYTCAHGARGQDWARGAYRARTLAPEERQAMWPRLVALYPAYADYQRRTSRAIQLIELAPV